MELVLEARKALAGRIRRTPIEFSPALSDVAKVPVFLKLESLQLTGSFKIRGAFFVMLRLSEEERRRGIVTCSAGNHGKGVAFVARELAIPAEIHVPRNVDESKYQGMLALGANVARSPLRRVRRDRAARKERGRAHGTAIHQRIRRRAHPGRERRVRSRRRRSRTACPRGPFFCPSAAPGLAGGFAFYAKTALPDCRIIGCQLALSPALALSLERGEAVLSLPPIVTTAGGLEGGIGKTGFDVLRSRVDGVALITEEEIFEAVRFMLDKHQYLIEPSSAVTVAAILTGKAGRLESPVAAVISGRNVALATIRRILAA